LIGESGTVKIMTIGDKVKLIGIPPDINNDAELRSRELFEKCLGRAFTIAGLETVEGLPVPTGSA
jgi:hypothetical protein